jgi:excisionase family DNA binding protein
MVIKNLALGIFKGEVFTNNHVDGSDLHLLPSIFLPLESLPEGKEKELTAHPPSMVYAYVKDALSNRTINGYPVFCAVCLLWKQDSEALATQYKNLMAAIDVVMDGQMMPTEKPPVRSAEVKPPAPSSQRLLSIKDFAASLGISVWTVRGWAYRGRIASVKLGARMMIPTTELDRVINENLRPAIGRTQRVVTSTG